ncbi:(6-4) photolyase [Thalassocella blandensis]|nr:(6-4) photolyase [Thalassocella blandensis]
MGQTKTLRLILGDQLNASHSWYKRQSDDVIYLIAELKQETAYVKHHIQKVCAFFLAMESFAKALTEAGHQVVYLTLDDTQAYSSLPALIQDVCLQYQCGRFEYQRADEYRLQQQLDDLPLKNISKHCYDTEHFILPFEEIAQYIKPQHHNLLESFYRKLRCRYDILMADTHAKKPEGGQWNFDEENRSPLKKNDLEHIPKAKTFNNDVSEILQRLARHGVTTFGKAMTQIVWPTNRKQSRQLLTHFITYGLPCFGRFQDAMTCQSPDAWSLYHSRLSFAINVKMLSPMQVIQAAVTAYRKFPERISLAQVEGFVRQILGWREYVRAVYWMNQPQYETLNTLEASNPLPNYFWNANTRMHCMAQSLGQSLDYAYAHHIQRLMVIGNFCLLTGIHPDQVDAWYLGVYVDAIQWVELPNTRGMSQFADGGLVATKPYVASANYLNKMSDYCTQCEYKVKEKTGKSACPFNSLYWNFLDKHQTRFENNPRMKMMYAQWNKRSEVEKTEIRQHAQYLITHLNDL